MADSVKAEQLIVYLNWCVLPLVLHVASHWYCYTYSDRNCYSMTKKWKSVVCDESAISWNLMKLESVYIIYIYHLVNKRNLFMCFYWNIHMSIRGSEIISFAFLPWMKVTRTNRVKNSLRLYYYYYYQHHHHHHQYYATGENRNSDSVEIIEVLFALETWNALLFYGLWVVPWSSKTETAVAVTAVKTSEGRARPRRHVGVQSELCMDFKFSCSLSRGTEDKIARRAAPEPVTQS
jgi:hypothetical protein